MDNHLPLTGDFQYQNPLQYSDKKSRTNPDPFILRWCGWYYCYSTHENGVHVSVSHNLTEWDSKGFALTDDEFQNYWAPAVIYRNGLFYLYYSNEPRGTKEAHAEFLKLAVCDNPLGPFIYKKTFFNKFSIDAHPVCWNGNYYLFYSTNDIMATSAEYAGTTISVDRLLDMETLEGNPKPVILASIKQEIFAYNRFGDGRDWYTIEGACFWKYGNICYLLYSANAYVNEDYFVGYAVAEPKKDLMEMMWSKYPDAYTFCPLMMRNNAVEGTGHNTITKAPNMVEDWIVYHGRDAYVPISRGTEERQMRIDPIFFSGLKMFTNGPSNQKQDAPALPEIHEESLQISQDYNISGHRLFYIAEVWLKADYSPDGAKYGLYANRIDDFNFVEVVFQSGLNTVTAVVMDNGIQQTPAEVALPQEYNHFVFHHIRIEKIFDLYRIEVDEVATLDFTYRMAKGEFGLSTHYSRLSAEGLAITRHCKLFGNELCELKRFYSVSPKASLTEIGLVPDSKGIFKMSRMEQYTKEFVETFTLNPLGACNCFSIESVTGDGKKLEWCRLQNIQESETIYIKKGRNVGWVLLGSKDIIPLKHVDAISEVSVHIKSLAVSSYTYTVLP